MRKGAWWPASPTSRTPTPMVGTGKKPWKRRSTVSAASLRIAWRKSCPSPRRPSQGAASAWFRSRSGSRGNSRSISPCPGHRPHAVSVASAPACTVARASGRPRRPTIQQEPRSSGTPHGVASAPSRLPASAPLRSASPPSAAGTRQPCPGSRGSESTASSRRGVAQSAAPPGCPATPLPVRDTPRPRHGRKNADSPRSMVGADTVRSKYRSPFSPEVSALAQRHQSARSAFAVRSRWAYPMHAMGSSSSGVYA